LELYKVWIRSLWLRVLNNRGYGLCDLGCSIINLSANTERLFRISIYSMRTTFTPYVKNGVTYLVGEEPNSFNPSENDPTKDDPAFYLSPGVEREYNGFYKLRIRGKVTEERRSDEEKARGATSLSLYVP